jgi:GTP-binding protein
VSRYDVQNEDALSYLEERLRQIGVVSALQAEGFGPGDQLEIAGVSLELGPGAAA